MTLLEIGRSTDDRLPWKASCMRCIAACCVKGTVIPLEPSEVEGMIAKGSQLHALPADKSQGNVPPAGREFYVLDEDCGSLVEIDGVRVCGDHDLRPKACREFDEGGFSCNAMRAARGVPKPTPPIPVQRHEDAW